MTTIANHSPVPNSQQWYRPTVSPEHGVYVMLIVSFLTGAATAQQWR
ncbi:YwiC-like family protein [Calothrix rhizosoleniae]|nr:YwiC-like family protein [Calothrix rhizosoleniae]